VNPVFFKCPIQGFDKTRHLMCGCERHLPVCRVCEVSMLSLLLCKKLTIFNNKRSEIGLKNLAYARL